MSNTETLVIASFLESVNKCLEKARQMYGVSLPMESIRADIAGTCGGRAYPNRGKGFKLNFNREAILKYNAEMTGDTVPHEVAHLVCFELGNDRGHGSVWKSTCRRLGGDDSRTHSMKLTKTREKDIIRHEYNVCGQIVKVGPRQHKAIQAGAQYSCQHARHGRMRILPHMWTEEAVKLNRTTREWKAPEGTVLSKLDRAKAIYKKSQGMSRKDIIAAFVAGADMTPAGAATYYQKFKAAGI